VSALSVQAEHVLLRNVSKMGTRKREDSPVGECLVIHFGTVERALTCDVQEGRTPGGKDGERPHLYLRVRHRNQLKEPRAGKGRKAFKQPTISRSQFPGRHRRKFGEIVGEREGACTEERKELVGTRKISPKITRKKKNILVEQATNRCGISDDERDQGGRTGVSTSLAGVCRDWGLRADLAGTKKKKI